MILEDIWHSFMERSCPCSLDESNLLGLLYDIVSLDRVIEDLREIRRLDFGIDQPIKGSDFFPAIKAFFDQELAWNKEHRGSKMRERELKQLRSECMVFFASHDV